MQKRLNHLAGGLIFCLVILVTLTSSFVKAAHTAVPSESGQQQQQQQQELFNSLTDSERRWLAEHPVLKLGIDKNFRPYEWIDKNNRYQGMASDYLSLIAERLNIQIEPVSDKNSWGEVLQAAREGEFDLMSCLVQTEEREGYLSFSQAYISSSAVIISQENHAYITGLKKLKGKRIAIHKGHFTNELLRKDYPDIEIVNTKNLDDALLLVADGKVEAFVGDIIAASYRIKQLGILNLSYSAQTEYRSEFRIGIKKEHAELVSIIDKTLNSITEQERQEIFDRWNSIVIKPGVPTEVIVRYGVLAFLILLVFLYWNYRLQRSKKALELSESNVRDLVNTTHACFWELDLKSDKVRYLNDNCRKINGFTEEELSTPDDWFNQIHPDDRQRVSESYEQQMKSGDHLEVEYRFYNRSGRLIWLKDIVYVVREAGTPVALRGLGIDNTAHKQAEELILQSETRFRELIDNLPTVAIQGYDEERRVIFWNEASEALYGYSKVEAIGRKLEELIIPDHMVDEVIESIRAWTDEGKPIEAAEVVLIDKEGAPVPVFSSHVVLNSPGSNREMYCIDISMAEQIKATDELRRMAHFDQLTELPNRHSFNNHLTEEMEKTIQANGKLAVMLLDLDHFKEINDTLGHEYGDLLLAEAADRLRGCVRESDMVARLGGDEFLIILNSANDMSAIERIAGDILQQLSEPFILKDQQSFVTASIGITLYPDDAANIETLLKNADQAMYAAKGNGRNRFSYFTPEMEKKALERRKTFLDLRDALANGQFELLYQPIINLNDGSLAKCEALIRWNHPDGVISPTQFIPVAEDTGLISDIGHWVFEEAARQTSEWLEQYGRELKISVNTSAAQYLDDHSSQAQWFLHLKDLGLHADNLCIEITESLLMEAKESVTDKLLVFKEQGIEVALDDFGTGYSSLAYLKEFDIDYIKIDRSFVRNIYPGSHDQVLCEAIIKMAQTLGMQVIAEGIETEDQRQLLKHLNCDFGQGYLFSRPVPADQFAAKWLEPLKGISNDH